MPRTKKINNSEIVTPNKVTINDILSETMLALKAKSSRGRASDSASRNVTNSLMFLEDIPETVLLPLESFSLQYVFGTKWFKPGTIIEIIGPEQVGKTAMVFTLLGMFMRSSPNIPALYVCSEGMNKMPNTNRIMHYLSTDKSEAEALTKNIAFFEGHAQKETLETIDQYCKLTREAMTKSGIPETVPILVAIDTISKLMPKSEAAGMGYGGEAAAKVAKGLGESSNLEFSKLMSEWTRKRADFTERYNVFMILVSHQNTKINMNALPGARMVSDANNKTKIGGHAIDQSATTQFTLTRVESKLNTLKDVVSHIIKLNVVKNSKGPDRRSILYELRVQDLQDDEDHYELALNFDYYIPELLAIRKLFGTRMLTKNKFTCEKLGLKEVTREKFIEAYKSDPKLQEELGKLYLIYGYGSNIIDPEIVKTNADIYAHDQSLKTESYMSSDEEPLGIPDGGNETEDVDFEDEGMLDDSCDTSEFNIPLSDTEPSLGAPEQDAVGSDVVHKSEEESQREELTKNPRKKRVINKNDL